MGSTVLKAHYILDILKKETDSKHRLTAAELSLRLMKEGIKAERRSIYRAVRALQQQGESIVTTRRGYYYDRIADEDLLFALSAAVTAASFLTEERRTAVLSALSQRFEKEAAALLLARAETLEGTPRKDDSLFLSLSTLSRAIDSRLQVSFLLQEAPDDRLRASPYALVNRGDSWLLLCALSREDSLSCIPVEDLREVRTEAQPRRHFSEVSPYKTRFDALDALRSFYPDGEKSGYPLLDSILSKEYILD